MDKKDIFTIKEVLADLEQQIKEAGSARVWAFENDFSPAFVSYVMNMKRPPSGRMLEYLGYERASDLYYRRKS